MNPQVEPQQKNKKTNPPLSLSSSLPNDIVVNCLARVSRSYYPKLSLVCKNFRSLILSKELHAARYHFRTIESVLHVCLQLSDHLRPSWFSLWIKPDQTLTNDIGKKQKKSTGNTLLVPTPSSYFPCVPMFIVTAGSEQYALTQYNAPSPALWVRNKELFWRKASNMTVARERAVLGVLDEKIYVMGGCGANETANWAEVFDPKTQTWEPLPDPGAEIRSSGIRKIEGIQGKLYVRCNEKNDYVYDTKQCKWDVAAAKGFVKCVIGNVLFGCDKKRCVWYDTKLKKKRPVRGLSTLNRSRGGDFVEIADYRGKLLILWDKFVHQGRCQFKNIWCAVIALERRNDDDDVWGNIEWANVVLTVPSSYVFLRSRLNAI